MAEELDTYDEEKDTIDEKSSDESYEEKRTKERAREDFEKLKESTIDFTNYQKIYQENVQTLNALRLLVGVEDQRLQKVAEDVNSLFESINKQNVRRGTGGIYEEPAFLLRTAMEFFEDRKELTELERAYQKILIKKLVDALAMQDGTVITSKAIELQKEMLVERLKQFEENIKENVNNKLEIFNQRIKTYEDIEEIKKQLEAKQVKIEEKDEKIESLTNQLNGMRKAVQELEKQLEAERQVIAARQKAAEIEASKPIQPVQSVQQEPETKPLTIKQTANESIKEMIGEEEYNVILKDYEKTKQEGGSLVHKTAGLVNSMRSKGFSLEEARTIARHFKEMYGVETASKKV